jgi:DNA-binding MarR family transcriptional regulator
VTRVARKTASKSHKTSDTKAGFDDEGVRLAILAALERVYESFPHITLPQYLIALEVRKAERDGKPHSLASLVKKLRMPFSTVSRVVWSLSEEGGDIGLVRYTSHPTDRRKKLLVMSRRNALRGFDAASSAMLDYYGDSARQLKRAS